MAEQVIVITGGTSGIGLTTARMLAEHGAKLFLVARNEEALRALSAEIRGKGGTADYAVADVADYEHLQAASAKAIATFGGFDTWINDAGAFIYGRLDEVSLADQRRLFNVTYWGVVHGTLIAAEHLKVTGGAVINVGSVLGEIAIPYQGPYCASKFAVKGFTEAFRREAEASHHPISVTLIKPAAINTPFTDHARNRMDSKGTRNPPPAYDAHLVARAIMHACTTPVRDLTIGGAGGISMVVGNRMAPRVMDWMFAKFGHTSMTTELEGDKAQRDNLYEPREDLHDESSLHPLTRRTSLALEVQLNPGPTAAVAGGLAAIALAVGSTRRRLSRRR
ncbi:SDR family oxidoreductase [Lichenicoccus roseus]|uniref:SDR family oxidoreductase n=1 Tax=Lichenicoccus roseus TaxID=2683649 RepID=UPI0023F2F128|nr:SDR family oxidoreductase [Lichenicoccus roseus]